ncbi:Serine/threonine-protein kinase DCLK3 [Diaporthe eres]|nr:Serine/threonine-protein kinase DCLK3 [Diaporthe eres]
MPSPSSPSLGDIAFMMGCFQGADTHELLQLGEGINNKFVFQPPRRSLAWRGQLPRDLEISAPIFGIPFGVRQKRAGRWILGSNTDLNEVDFKVAKNNRQGVSKKCLSIDFTTYQDRRPILRITNESDNAQLYIQHGESATVDEASRITLDGTVYTKVPKQSRARGASGTVFIVKRVGGDSTTLCAKELISEDGLASSSIAKRQTEELRKEFKSYTRFTHPHLAVAIDIAYMQDGSALPWLILEHIPFGLADYITRHPQRKPWPKGPLATLDPADIISQLFSFAAFLHRQEVVHRDLSPSNIRLYPDMTRWVVKVIDLGTLESVHHMQSSVGTPGYAAPEMLSDRPKDEKVDIFSLGMIAFYLLTDLRPQSFAGTLSAEDQVQHMRNEVLPHLDEVDDKFRTLLGGLLAYEAKDRWSAQKVINYFWWLRSESDPNCHRKRTASPMAFPENKKRRMSEDASTIRGPRAESEYPPSSTSFETAQEQAQQSQDGLTSVPATPFSEVDFETEPANDWPLVDESDHPDVSYDGSDDKDWVFTFNLKGWIDRPDYTPHASPDRDQGVAPVSDSGAETDDVQLGPSWVTGNTTETEGLAVDRPRTGCTADVEKLQLGGHTCTDGTDSEAETDIQTSSSLQSGWFSGGFEGPYNRLDAHDFHLPCLYQPGTKGQSKDLHGRASSPTSSENVALEDVLTTFSIPQSAHSIEQSAHYIPSISSSCYENRSRDIEEGNRLAGSFGARPTYPRDDVLS